MTDNVYDLGKELLDHPFADSVEVRKGRITVAHVPEDRHTESIPECLFNYLNRVIKRSPYQWEVRDPSPERVGKHKLTGGVHMRSISGESVELQANFVKTGVWG